MRGNDVNLAEAGGPPGAATATADQSSFRGACDRGFCAASDGVRRPGDLAVLAAAEAYVSESGLLPLRVAKIAVTGAVITPFRAVFIEVENSPELREFRAAARHRQRSAAHPAAC